MPYRAIRGFNYGEDDKRVEAGDILGAKEFKRPELSRLVRRKVIEKVQDGKGGTKRSGSAD